MVSTIAVPSFVMRSASHAGTCPPWRGRSASPERFIQLFSTPGIDGSGSRCCQRLALFDNVHRYQLERSGGGIVGIMLCAGRNDEAIARFDVAWRLPFDQDLALSLGDVTNLLAGMGMTTRPGARSNLDARDHSLAARNRHVRLVHNSALNSRVLPE